VSSLQNSKIYVAGHNGLVGSSIIRILKNNDYKRLITASRKKLDLVHQRNVDEFFEFYKPDYVIVAAAKVGGINANNQYKAEFLFQNLAIQTNIINASYINNVKKLIFLGSSCIYPKLCKQPIMEEYLLSGELEKTNEPYSIAKIAGIKMCEYYYKQYNCNFISLMPTNLYGPNDNYDLQSSHVLPALINKFYNAKINKSKNVEIWGSGKPRREFMHVDELANACVFVLESINAKTIYDQLNVSHLNIGTGKDISIKELAKMLMSILNINVELKFNKSMPDGTPQKLLDVTRINNLGWKNMTSLEEGLVDTIIDYKNSLG